MKIVIYAFLIWIGLAFAKLQSSFDVKNVRMENGVTHYDVDQLQAGEVNRLSKHHIQAVFNKFDLFF